MGHPKKTPPCLKVRRRPLRGFTLTAETSAALDARAKETGAPVSHVAEDALRIGLGLPKLERGPR